MIRNNLDRNGEQRLRLTCRGATDSNIRAEVVDDPRLGVHSDQLEPVSSERLDDFEQAGAAETAHPHQKQAATTTVYGVLHVRDKNPLWGGQRLAGAMIAVRPPGCPKIWERHSAPIHRHASCFPFSGSHPRFSLFF